MVNENINHTIRTRVTSSVKARVYFKSILLGLKLPLVPSYTLTVGRVLTTNMF